MIEKSNIFGVILAGGGSRRMGGRDKFLLPLGEAPLLQHVIDRVRPQVEDLCLSYNGDPERVESFGLPVLRDTIDDPGPLGGILAGLQAAREKGHDYLLSTACDVPFVPVDYAARLSTAAERDDVPLAVAESGGRVHPVMGLWHVSLAGDLQDWLMSGERKVMTWLNRHSYKKVVWGNKEDVFMNINTPEDLDRARKLLS